MFLALDSFIHSKSLIRQDMFNRSRMVRAGRADRCSYSYSRLTVRFALIQSANSASAKLPSATCNTVTTHDE